MKTYNNTLLKQIGEKEAEKMRGEYNQLQLAIGLHDIVPYAIPKWKHSVKELEDLYKNNRPKLLHWIHVYGYAKAKPGFEKGDKKKVELVRKFLSELARAQRKDACLRPQIVIQESLFSDQQMDELIPVKPANFGKD